MATSFGVNKKNVIDFSIEEIRSKGRCAFTRVNFYKFTSYYSSIKSKSEEENTRQ